MNPSLSYTSLFDPSLKGKDGECQESSLKPPNDIGKVSLKSRTHVDQKFSRLSFRQKPLLL